MTAAAGDLHRGPGLYEDERWDRGQEGGGSSAPSRSGRAVQRTFLTSGTGVWGPKRERMCSGSPNGTNRLWGTLAPARCPASRQPTILAPTLPAAADASDRQVLSDRQGIAFGDVTAGSKTAGGDGPGAQTEAVLSPEFTALCESPRPKTASTHAALGAPHDVRHAAKNCVGGVAV